jgi:hypothetical protein
MHFAHDECAPLALLLSAWILKPSVATHVKYLLVGKNSAMFGTVYEGRADIEDGMVKATDTCLQVGAAHRCF